MTAWCSNGDVMITFLSLLIFCAFHQSPLIAVLFASVPLPVNIISLGKHPAKAAIDSRASSTSLRISRPWLCKLDAFPIFDTCRVKTSIASSTIGVVAA